MRMHLNPALGRRLVLVTGGAGYVGSTVCRELLGAGHRVRVLDNLMYEEGGSHSLLGVVNHPRFELRRGDIRCEDDVKGSLEGVDTVVHLAAIVGDTPCAAEPEAARETNVDGTRLLAQAARAAGATRFVFASTCSNYGIMDTRRPATEASALNPVSLYAETKVCCEEMLLAMAEGGGFEPVVLRFATGYGVSGRTRFDLLVHSFVFEAIQAGRLSMYGADTWRPYIHVYDMAKVMELALEAPGALVGGRVLNAGSNEQNYTKAHLASLIRAELPHVEVELQEGSTDRRSYRVSFDRIRRVLGFRAQRTVTDGIREVILAVAQGLLTVQDYERSNLLRFSA